MVAGAMLVLEESTELFIVLEIQIIFVSVTILGSSCNYSTLIQTSFKHLIAFIPVDIFLIF